MSAADLRNRLKKPAPSTPSKSGLDIDVKVLFASRTRV